MLTYKWKGYFTNKYIFDIELECNDMIKKYEWEPDSVILVLC